LALFVVAEPVELPAARAGVWAWRRAARVPHSVESAGRSQLGIDFVTIRDSGADRLLLVAPPCYLAVSSAGIARERDGRCGCSGGRLLSSGSRRPHAL
jgi:hypothetical protein